MQNEFFHLWDIKKHGKRITNSSKAIEPENWSSKLNLLW